MMMLRILRRRIVVVVVIVIPIRGERMMHAAIRDPAMPQRHMPGGKEPAEQKQKCDETLVRAHSTRIREGTTGCQTRYARAPF